jgi:hypothetical protein
LELVREYAICAPDKKHGRDCPSWKQFEQALSRIRQRLEELEAGMKKKPGSPHALVSHGFLDTLYDKIQSLETKLSEQSELLKQYKNEGVSASSKAIREAKEQSGLAELGRLAKVWAESEAHVSEIGSRVRHHLSKQEKK